MPTTRTAGRTPGSTRHQAHGDDNPAAEAGMSRDVINIGQHIFKRAIRAYQNEGKADGRQIELLEWCWGYAFDELGGSRSGIQAALGYDWNYIYKIFSGRHEAGLEKFCDAIAHLQRQAALRIPQLINTPVTDRIIQALNYARDANAMVMVCGTTGRSKTWTAEHWVRNNNHGRAKYIRIPSACTRRTLVRRLAKTCGIGVNGRKTSDIEDRLFQSFSWRNTLVFDEVGHCMPRTGTATSSIEFIRDFHDECRCGVALIATYTEWDEMRNGRMAAFFEQLVGRIKFRVDIPNDVLKAETEACCRAFHPSPNRDLLREAHRIARAQDGRLRTLFEDLQRARQFAADQGHTICADDLRLAATWRQTGITWPTEN